LLYQEGFTISGARHRLEDGANKDNENGSESAAASGDVSSVSVRGELTAIIDFLRSA
jgi:hypothetical protein